MQSGAWVKIAHPEEYRPGEGERLVYVRGSHAAAIKALEIVVHLAGGHPVEDSALPKDGCTTLVVPRRAINSALFHEDTDEMHDEPSVGEPIPKTVIEKIMERAGRPVVVQIDQNLRTGVSVKEVNLYGEPGDRAEAAAMIDKAINEWRERYTSPEVTPRTDRSSRDEINDLTENVTDLEQLDGIEKSMALSSQAQSVLLGCVEDDPVLNSVEMCCVMLLHKDVHTSIFSSKKALSRGVKSPKKSPLATVNEDVVGDDDDDKVLKDIISMKEIEIEMKEKENDVEKEKDDSDTEKGSELVISSISSISSISEETIKESYTALENRYGCIIDRSIDNWRGNSSR